MEKILVALQLGQYDLAFQLLAQQHSFSDDVAGVYLQCVSLLYTGEKDEAALILDRGIAKNPNSVFLQQLGTIFFDSIGFSDKAAKCAEKALQIAPEDSSSLAAMASLLIEQGQDAEAAQFSQKAVEQAPDDVENKLLHAVTLFSAEGNNVTSHKLINETLATDPGNREALRIKEKLSMDRKDKLKYLKKNLAAHPEDKASQKRLEQLTTGYNLTILYSIIISICVMVSAIVIPPDWRQSAGVLVSLLGPLLLLYYIEHTELAFCLTFSWIVFFDIADKKLFPPVPEGLSFLQISGHLLGAAIFTYLLIKMFEFLRNDIDGIDWEVFTNAKNLPKAVAGTIKKILQDLDDQSRFFYLLSFVVVPGCNLLAYFHYPIFLVPCLLASHLLLGWTFSSLLQFDDINLIVIAVGAYALATLAISFFVHVLLGNNVLLLILLLLGVYVGSTVSKNTKALLEMVEQYEAIEAQLAKDSRC